MNLSSCKSIRIGDKEVAVLSLNGKQVYTSSDVRLYMTCSKEYILAGETAVLTLYTNLGEDTEIELYYGDSLTKTLLDTVETDENGVAEYTYTGTGAGELSLFAEYDEYTSNIVILDDYEPVATGVALSLGSSSVTVGSSVSLTGTVTDQHGVGISGLTVTFKHGSTTIGTATTDGSGVATKSWATDTVGALSITASCSGVTSSAQTLNVVKHSSALSSSASPTSAYIGDTVTLSGTLKIDDVGTSGLSVKIYKDSSLLDTVTTGTGGAFSKSTSFSSNGAHTLYAVYEGSSVNESATGSTYNITVSKIPTSLSITVPQLVYSDTFSITGVLTDNNSSPLGSESVKLYMETGGSTTLEATGTTNSDGEVTFSRQAPTTITEYKFWLVYEGDSTYVNVNSSEETRTVGKETSVLTITAPLNNASYTVGDSVTVSGTLLSNDGEAMASKSVLVKESSTTLATLTTDSNGAFTGSLSSLASGSHTLSVEFAGDTYYTSVTGSRTITLSSITPSSVSLTSNKSILSYADSDSATLTATVTGSDSNPYSGASVEIYSGSTKLGDATDNSDGTYTYTLASTGGGDLSLTAKVGSLVSETYEVEDCWRYDTASTNKTSSYASPIVYRGSGSGQLNYNSSNGYYGTISGSNEVMIPLSEIIGKDNVTIEFDALFNANIAGDTHYGIAGICAYENNNNYSRLSCHNLKIAQRVCVNGSASETEDNVTNSVSRGDLLHFKFTINNNQIVEEVTRGTTSIGTKTISYTPTSSTKYGIAFVWSNNWVKDTYLKNIKVKPL